MRMERERERGGRQKEREGREKGRERKTENEDRKRERKVREGREKEKVKGDRERARESVTINKLQRQILLSTYLRYEWHQRQLRGNFRRLHCCVHSIFCGCRDLCFKFCGRFQSSQTKIPSLLSTIIVYNIAFQKYFNTNYFRCRVQVKTPNLFFCLIEAMLTSFFWPALPARGFSIKIIQFGHQKIKFNYEF